MRGVAKDCGVKRCIQRTINVYINLNLKSMSRFADLPAERGRNRFFERCACSLCGGLIITYEIN